MSSVEEQNTTKPGVRSFRTRWNEMLSVFLPPESMRSLWFKDFVRVPKRIIAASMLVNIFGLAMPIVILQVYDRVIPNVSYETLSYLIGGLFFVLFVDTLMKIIRSHIAGWSSAYVDHVAGVEAIRQVLAAASVNIEKEAPSVHIDRMNALSSTARMFAGPARMGLVDLPFVFLFIGVMAIISPIISLVLLVLFVGFACLLLSKTSQIQISHEERQELDRRKYDFVIEALSDLETLKTMACEPMMMRRYERLLETIAETFYKSIRLDGATQALSAGFAGLTMVAIIGVGAAQVIHGTQSLGSLAACMLLGGRSVEVLVRSIRSWSELSSFRLVKQDVDALFSLNPDYSEISSFYNVPDGYIEFKNASVTMNDGSGGSIRNANCKILAGTFLGIKSSECGTPDAFIGLLRGQISPTEGSVEIDGTDAFGYYRSVADGDISYVSAVPAVFRGTILENITVFNTRFGIENARKAAQLIGLEADIQQLPKGYDTPLGTGGTEAFPPSFLQRIAIARALAHQPKILILDDANATLDRRSDNMLRNGLQSVHGQMTIVFVSNRPSFLAIADNQYSAVDGVLEFIEPEEEEFQASRLVS
ncbi:MAG: hypothetical protein COB90_09930 [Hyphomicrobiales bacterium]|nr:MAG: hypothetical protein COB90_09930 [Hyphomicrobiales bacterium]